VDLLKWLFGRKHELGGAKVLYFFEFFFGIMTLELALFEA
jgi:hypothetical protein